MSTGGENQTTKSNAAPSADVSLDANQMGWLLKNLFGLLMEVAERAKSYGQSIPQMDDSIEQVRKQIPEFLPMVEPIRRQQQRLMELAAMIGEPEDILLAKALAFYKDALEAERQGNRVAILNKDDEIISELSGFGRPATEVLSSSDK